jgi:hypothetical protein
VTDQDVKQPDERPRTSSVLGLLALTALTFSYLVSYAVTNALVAEQVMSPWPREHDPRPKWLIMGFCLLMLVFMILGEVLRRLSLNEFKAIDDMAEADEKAA